ncbi:MAG: hypothetical protein IT436_17915 [Phycisphaerales bacterium]|nr:hypothetical protein [Phycisphaerales bacterium]
MPRRSKAGPYSVHPGVAMVREWIGTLRVKTGRSLEEWMAHIRKAGPKDEKLARQWLKDEHALSANSAWWLAERACARPGATWDDDPDQYLLMAHEYVEAMFAGPKAGLRPIYDRLLTLGLSIGKDVKACPCKTIVPLYRNHVFAQLKPSTRARLDLGLALARHKGKLPARLIDTGGLAKKDRITHRIEISSVDVIDSGVEKWLKIAYDLDA